jgi:hypothetical protein
MPFRERHYIVHFSQFVSSSLLVQGNRQNYCQKNQFSINSVMCAHNSETGYLQCVKLTCGLFTNGIAVKHKICSIKRENTYDNSITMHVVELKQIL